MQRRVFVTQVEWWERSLDGSVEPARSEDMEPVYFVMAILGCSDMQTQCEQARIEPIRYQTAAQCQVAMTDVLPRHTDLLFPTIAATCQRSGNLIARAETKPRG